MVVQRERRTRWWWFGTKDGELSEDAVRVDDGACFGPEEVSLERSSPSGSDLHDTFQVKGIAESGVDDSGMPEFLCVPSKGRVV